MFEKSGATQLVIKDKARAAIAEGFVFHCRLSKAQPDRPENRKATRLQGSKL
ncbi:MAG: hypothetical protein AAFX04_13175 [Pseudomonadota bacterium]